MLTIFVSFIAIDCAAQDAQIDTKLANTLNFYKICTGNNYLRLVSDIRDKKVTEGFDVLHYCDKAIILDVANYKGEPEQYVERLHHDISGLLPELAFTGFRAVVSLDSTASNEFGQSYNTIVSLHANGRVYKEKDLIIKGTELGIGYSGKIENNFYEVFNKILVDIQSPYRIYIVNRNEVDFTKLGVIALTKQQYSEREADTTNIPVDVLNYKEDLYYHYDDTLTSQKIEEALTSFRKIGLFNHLTEEQIINSTEIVNEKNILNPTDALVQFPGVLESFSVEFQNDDTPYTELTKKVFTLLHVGFTPTQFHENIATPVNGKATFGFSVKGKLYTTQQLDKKNFLSFLNRVLQDSNIKGQFYLLAWGGSTVEGTPVIFLTDAQSEYIKANHLIAFYDSDN
ncbi:MAG: hypothetical protein ACHQF0_00055 [Chitinophagales bacterium]